VTQAPTIPAEQSGQMTHREVLEALSGLLLAMFVAMLSSTIVSNALPTIVDDLQGSQTGYTWVVVATMLAMTATTTIWGKFADLFDKKLLVQTALIIFSVGSLIGSWVGASFLGTSGAQFSFWGLILGTVFGIQALGKKGDFDDDPTVDNADDAERAALIADMSFGVALTFGITGAVLLFSGGGDEEAATEEASAMPKLLPLAGPKGGGMAATWKF